MSKFFIGILFLLTLLVHPVSAVAMQLTIDSISKTDLNHDEEFVTSISLVSAPADTIYYFQIALTKEIGSAARYFGYTQNRIDNWIKYGENHNNFYRINTNALGNWNGTIRGKPDSEDSDFKGSGDYFLKIGRFTEGGSRFWSDNELTINITAPPTPTPENTPDPTNTPVPELEPAEDEDCDGDCPLIGADDEVVTTSLADFPKQLQGPDKPLGPEKILGAEHEHEQEDEPEKKSKSKSSKLIPTLLITVGLGIISYPIWQEIKKRRRIENPFKRKRS